MSGVFKHTGFLLLGLILTAAVSAETDLTGEIGVDLESISYGTELKDTAWDYSARRSGSSHFINLSMLGPLGNSHFANYATNLRLYGSYFRSATNLGSSTDYIKPGIRGFYGQATFLPEKPFPLRLYRSDANDYPLQYEPNNRSDRERLQPALSIVRRYRHDRDASGGVWQFSPSENVRLLSEYKEENSKSRRIYDFGENLDIWVTVIASAARPGDTVFTVLVNNNLPDTADIEIVNLDSVDVNPGFPPLLIDDLPPNHTSTVYLFPGRTELQIASDGFNPFFDEITVDSNLIISIKYDDPAAPNDLEQKRKSITNKLKFGNDKSRATNETYYEYSDQREMVQKQLSYIHNFSNTVNYRLSEKVKTNMLFSLQENRTRIDTVSIQWNRMLMNQTNMTYFKRQGLSASLSHIFSRSSSHIGNPSLLPDTTGENGNDTLKSTLNNLMGRLTYPSKKLNHRFDLRTNISLLSDNQDFVNNRYTGEIINNMELLAVGARWQPQHMIKYSYNVQENPSKKANEIETKLSIIGMKSTALWGDLKWKSEISYRNRWDKIGSDIKKRYKFDMSVIRKFGEKLRLSFLGNQEWEVTSGSAPATSGSSSGSETRYKSSYKFDVSAVPVKDISLSSNVMIITQGENSINKFGFSMNAIIPVIKMPLKSLVLAESRTLKGQDPQNQISIETSISHRIRKISLILKHLYVKESLSFEDYTLNEIHGKISRQFGVF